MKQHQRFYTCLALITAAYPAWSGQVSVVNPSAGSGVAIVSSPAPATPTPPSPAPPSPAPTLTVSTTVTPPPTTTTVDVLPTAPAVTPDVVSTISVGGSVDTPVMEISNTSVVMNLSSEPQTLIGQIVNVFAPASQPAGASSASSDSTSSGNGSKVGSAQQQSAPTTVSQFVPQIAGAVQSINVSTFTPQQLTTLVATIDAQLGQAGLSPAARQVLTTERARLGGITGR